MDSVTLLAISLAMAIYLVVLVTWIVVDLVEDSKR